VKKLFILSEYFPPSFASTGFLLEELADGLGLSGEKARFDVTVVTSIRKNGFDESKKNYKAKRLSFFRLDKNKKYGKIINGLVFFISCFFYVLFYSKKDVTLIIVSNPPYLPVLGYLFYKLRKQKFIYLIHDQYPEIAVNLGYMKEKSPITGLWKHLNNKVFSSSAKTVALGKMAGRHISDMYPVITKRGNLTVIPNWCDRVNIYPLENKASLKSSQGFENKFVVRYSGNLGLFHGLEVIIETAAALKDNDIIVFHITGGGGKRNELMEMSKTRKLENIVFGGFIPHELLNESLNCADVALVTLDTKASNLSVPSKYYPLIAAGLPVIAVMDKDTDIAKEIIDSASGYVCKSDPYDISAKIMSLYESAEKRKSFSINARNLFLEKYEKGIIIEQYKKLLGELQ
jgi:glycosyltransferase involved in cell wall biosynthesis